MLMLFDDDPQDNLALRALFQLFSTKGSSRCCNIPISLIMRCCFPAKPQKCRNEADERASRSEKGGKGEE